MTSCDHHPGTPRLLHRWRTPMPRLRDSRILPLRFFVAALFGWSFGACAASGPTNSSQASGMLSTNSKTVQVSPEFVGRTFDLLYSNKFHVVDKFGANNILTFTVLSGQGAVRHGRAIYHWYSITDHIYAISWTEYDGGTVVHIDDFQHHLSRSFYTPSGGKLMYSQAEIH